MDDKTLVERLHIIRDRYGMMYDDYDDITEAATRIEALKAALRIEIWNGLKRNGMSDDAATAMVKERMAALEGTGNG